MAYYRTPVLNNDKNLQAYIIGLAVGDGNLSNPNGRAVRLRISCDIKYPNLIKRVTESLQKLFPENKVGTVNRPKANALDVYVYSNHLENLLGWKASRGSKFKQNVSTPKWIYKSDEYKIGYLKGLIETDGSIYYDRGYPMVIITTIIRRLAKEVKNIIDSLDFQCHLYEIDGRVNKYNYNKQIEYHIRLSKDVKKFLELVKPDKS